MKKIAALTAILFMGSAFAQTETSLMSSTGQSHMFEFNADTILNGAISFSKSKTSGSSADNDMNLDLKLNYAYTIPMLPRLQLGGGVTYFNGTEAGRGDTEDYGFNFAAYANMLEDLQNSPYASIKWGVTWANTYGGNNGNTKDEVGRLQLAVGKRFGLTPFGIKHLTYTPEVAFVNEDSTTRSALEYSQSLEFRFLQFSVFF